MLPTNPQEAPSRLTAAIQYANLVEVFVDDFIVATNDTSMEHLQRFSRAMLLGVHSVFPPPLITGHQGKDLISQKKLQQEEGRWATTKEILSWLVDGTNFTIQLTPENAKRYQNLSRKCAK